MREVERIADQLQRAFEGRAWHGPSLAELLKGVSAEEAAARPVPGRHSIWEMVLHNIAWNEVVSDCARGEPMKGLPSEEDWPEVEDLGEESWRRTLERFDEVNRRLVKSVSAFSDDRLDETVPGKSYSYYAAFHGIIQHNLYHAGQMAILRRKRS